MIAMTQTRLDFADSDRRAANPTRWEAAKQSPPVAEGFTYEPEADKERISTLQQAVIDCMTDGNWRTLAEIRNAIGKGSEAGISARIRDMRKSRCGSHIVERRRRLDKSQGLFEYRVAS